MQMQNKMQAHFTQRLNDCECQSTELLTGLDKLAKDLTQTRENLTQENASLEKLAKKIIVKKQPKPTEDVVDLTEMLKSHRLRCEIERSFFFHVNVELLRSRF